MGQFDGLFYKFDKVETHSDGMLPPLEAYFRGDSCIKGAQIYLPLPGVHEDGRDRP